MLFSWRRIVRSTERALSSDSLEVQDGCLCGLLYVVEDPGSQLEAHLAAPTGQVPASPAGVISQHQCICCVGEQGNYVNEDEETEAAVEMSVLTREYVGILVEHLRHSPLEGVRFLVGVVPVVMVDFLPPVQVLQMVVTEFVSPHQPRPSLAAIVMGETFSLVLGKNMGDTLTDWVLLSLDSFVQQEPEKKAVWCLVCLLAAASSSSILRAMLEVVADQPNMCLSHMQILLATTSFYFCSTQASCLSSALLLSFQSIRCQPSSKRCL
ncbi:Huntingtin [Geodia barretti]|uniref:Huntingtin n=1 Tax=Geodia barretti TaxID=519541 RepID=A0AA35VWG4_GEOBA|nr:Huntingtin [Geodia barretti]